MSRLFYISFRREHQETAEPGSVFGDTLLATFIGTPVQTLGQAMHYFNTQSLERNERVASGMYPQTPDVILEAAQKYLETPLADRNKFTVVQTDEGFMIWISDGPDRYVLVD